uniref:Secreted protein n=1 Tax=Lates calcarifer TaxID=8187 RepID=A0A4W6FT38_LATCA
MFSSCQRVRCLIAIVVLLWSPVCRNRFIHQLCCFRKKVSLADLCSPPLISGWRLEGQQRHHNTPESKSVLQVMEKKKQYLWFCSCLVHVGLKCDNVSLIHTLGCGILQTLDLLGELVLRAGLRRSMSSAVSCCWIGSAKDTRLDCKVKGEDHPYYKLV